MAKQRSFIKTIALIFILFFFFSFLPGKIFALEKVVINEIAWMGNEQKATKEWIELYNPGEQSVVLTGWTLAGNNFLIKLEGEIKPANFFLLERTNNESAAEIPADQIYSGALSNQGEKLFLRNQNKKIVDLVDCSDGWFAGQSAVKLTMSRISSLLAGNESTNWTNSGEPGGTAKRENDFLKDKKAQFILIEEINNNFKGQLLKTAGLVIEKTGRNIFLSDQDGREIRVDLSKEINLRDLKIKEGYFLMVQGFLNVKQDELRLSVFQKEDLSLLSRSNQDVSHHNYLNPSESNVIRKGLIISSVILLAILLLSFRKKSISKNEKSS